LREAFVMYYDETADDLRECGSRASPQQIDWEGWRREVRSRCGVLRGQIDCVGRALGPDMATTAKQPFTPAAGIRAPSGEVCAVAEDRLALLRRQLNSQIESGVTGPARDRAVFEKDLGQDG